MTATTTEPMQRSLTSALESIGLEVVSIALAPYSLGDGRMAIPLTQGCTAVIDEADWPLVEGYNWHVEHGEGTHRYAVGRPRNSPRGTPKARMHRLILNAPEGMGVDHKDGDGLNNTRANLRLCTQQENLRNTRRRAGNYSRFKGVSFDKRRHSKPWCAQIKDGQGVKRNLGRFATEEEAARCYDEAARRYFGEFARTNFV